MSLLALLSPRLLAARHAFRRGRTQPLVLLLLTLVFWAGAFLLFERTLGYFQTIGALGPVLTQRLLVLIFVSFFAVLLLSNVVTALTTFYGAAEVTLLLAAPVSARRLHQARFVETVAASSWMVLLFGMPVFAAYGVVYGAGPLFYVATVVTLVPFLVVPAAIGVLATTALVLLVPARRARDVLLVAGVTLGAGAYLTLRLLQPEQLASPAGLAGFAAFLADIGAPSPFLPTTWAAEVLIPLLGARPGEPLFHLGLLASTAAVLYLASAGAVERVFLVAWSRAQEGRGGGGGERRLMRGLALLAAPLPRVPGVLLVKDLAVFLRDPSQWSQLIVLAALVVLYLYNFSVLPVDDGSPLASAMRELSAFLNLGLSAFVTTSVAVRFVFPAVSLEGRSWWILRTAPIPLTTIWWSKFAIGFLPLTLLGEALVVVTNRFLGVAPGLTLLFMGTLLLLVAAIVSLGLAFGAAYPRFDTLNPAQIATSFGALVYMVTCLGLIALVVALEAWPVSRVFWYRVGRAPLGAREVAVVAAALAAVVGSTVTTRALGPDQGIARNVSGTPWQCAGSSRTRSASRTGARRSSAAAAAPRSRTSRTSAASPSPPVSIACRIARASAPLDAAAAPTKRSDTPPAITAAAVSPGGAAAASRTRPSRLAKSSAVRAASRLRQVTSRRARAANGRGAAAWLGSPGGGVASSTSTPPVPFGWRKQIIPARPRRGDSSISGSPAARAASSSARTSGVSKQT
jgi:ABC-2 type transport system permease protein